MERRAVSRAFESRVVSPRHPGPARLGSVNPSFLTIGIAAHRLPTIDQLNGVSAVILCGVAGALDPSLRIGDLLLDDPGELISPVLTFRRGTVFTTDHIVATPIEKARLFTQTRAAAVDMEQSIVREFAKRRGIPVLGLRAISDTADQTLDSAVINLVDNLGQPKPFSIMSALIRRPGLIPYLRQLNANTRLALSNLGPALVSVIDELQRDTGPQRVQGST